MIKNVVVMNTGYRYGSHSKLGCSARGKTLSSSLLLEVILVMWTRCLRVPQGNAFAEQARFRLSGWSAFLQPQPALVASERPRVLYGYTAHSASSVFKLHVSKHWLNLKLAQDVWLVLPTGSFSLAPVRCCLGILQSMMPTFSSREIREVCAERLL